MGEKPLINRLGNKFISFAKRVSSSDSIKSVNKKEYFNKKFLPWQLHDGAPGQERSLVIGFDIGTACSKVVIQDKNIRKAYAVPFERFGTESNKYLLPTEVFVNKDGKIGIDGGESKQKNLKVGFMEDPNQYIFKEKNIEITVKDLIAAYFGLALIEVRTWFRNNKSNDYKHINIEWQFNIGLPSLSYDNQKLLKNFKIAALAGWNMSLLSGDGLSIDMVKLAIETAKKQLEENICNKEEGQIHPELINPIPEIIAEVLGYVNSPLRENGMFMMVDVGASTLDISTFVLYSQNEENVFSILWPDVKPLGAYILHQRRMGESDKIFKKKLAGLECLCDGINPLPDISQYLQLSPDDYKCVEQCDSDFLQECSQNIRSVIGVTKKRRNPLSKVWETGLPVFLCGGGSKIELYQSVFQHAAEKLSSINFYGFDIKNLPKPSNLEADDIPPRDYHRIAVAYGLSFSGFDIGKIIPSRDVEDLVWQPTLKDTDQYFVDKDLV